MAKQTTPPSPEQNQDTTQKQIELEQLRLQRQREKQAAAEQTRTQRQQDQKEKKKKSSVFGKSRSDYRQSFGTPITQQTQAKAREHAQMVVNIGELATVALSAGATAEINHTRKASSIWAWRIVELGTSGLVMSYNGTRNTLGRIGMGVFAGALAETLIDSTPGLTGQAVRNPPVDAQIVTYKEI